MKNLPPAYRFKDKNIQHLKKKKVHGMTAKGLGPSEKVLPEFLKARMVK